MPFSILVVQPTLRTVLPHCPPTLAGAGEGAMEFSEKVSFAGLSSRSMLRNNIFDSTSQRLSNTMVLEKYFPSHSKRTLLSSTPQLHLKDATQSSAALKST